MKVLSMSKLALILLSGGLLIVVGLGIGYYFGNEQSQIIEQPNQQTEFENKELLFAKKQECIKAGRQAEERLNEIGSDVLVLGPTFYYSEKLNTCIIEGQAMGELGDIKINFRFVKDAYTDENIVVMADEKDELITDCGSCVEDMESFNARKKILVGI